MAYVCPRPCPNFVIYVSYIKKQLYIDYILQNISYSFIECLFMSETTRCFLHTAQYHKYNDYGSKMLLQVILKVSKMVPVAILLDLCGCVSVKKYTQR